MTNTKLVTDILQNILVQNVNKAFVYITDWTSPLIKMRQTPILVRLGFIWDELAQLTRPVQLTGLIFKLISYEISVHFISHL